MLRAHRKSAEMEENCRTEKTKQVREDAVALADERVKRKRHTENSRKHQGKVLIDREV